MRFTLGLVRGFAADERVPVAPLPQIPVAYLELLWEGWEVGLGHDAPGLPAQPREVDHLYKGKFRNNR